MLSYPVLVPEPRAPSLSCLQAGAQNALLRDAEEEKDRLRAALVEKDREAAAGVARVTEEKDAVHRDAAEAWVRSEVNNFE